MEKFQYRQWQAAWTNPASDSQDIRLATEAGWSFSLCFPYQKISSSPLSRMNFQQSLSCHAPTKGQEKILKGLSSLAVREMMEGHPGQDRILSDPKQFPTPVVSLENPELGSEPEQATLGRIQHFPGQIECQNLRMRVALKNRFRKNGSFSSCSEAIPTSGYFRKKHLLDRTAWMTLPRI